MTGPDVLFPGVLRAGYDAFVAAMEEAGPAQRQFARTQVCYRLKRQFAWLTPVSRTRSLLTLDMYQPHPDPLVQEIIEYRPDKHTHQIMVTGRDEVDAARAKGWFAEARRWGDKA